MTITIPDTTNRRASQSPWAVETHGLTKRSRANVAVNGVELLVPRRRLRLPRAERRRQDHPHPCARRD